MKKNKLICLTVVIALIYALLSSCSAKENATDGNTGAVNSENYSEIKAKDDGTVTIPTGDISKTAKFFNYDANGVTVQLVALRDKNDNVHIAFNTCQSCSPSPKAYYQQSGGVLKCTNCGFTFEPEQVGITAGGCNPWPIDGVSIGENEITIPAVSLEAMRSSFTSWAGPTE